MMRTDDYHLRGWTVSRGISWRGIAVGAAVLALGITVSALVFGQGPSEDLRDGSALTADARDDASDETSSGAGTGAWTASSPLVATNDAGEIVPPTSTTNKPAPPATPASPADPATPATPATPPGGLTPEEQAYLKETKKVVEENAGDLGGVATAVTEALSSGDAGDLSVLMTGDEGDQAAYVLELAERYPTISEYALGNNINIFSASDTTVYFAYALVVWTDGGITSQHTIPIVLRFVDGEWRLSSLGDTRPDLAYVQSVTL